MIRWNDFEFDEALGPILGNVQISEDSFKSVNTANRSDIKDDDRESLNQETRRGSEPARMVGGRSNLENSTDEGRKDAAALDRISVFQPRGAS